MEVIFGKIGDLAIGEVVRRFQGRGELRKGLEACKGRIIYSGLNNDIAPALHALRAFLIQHDLADAKRVRPFFECWLADDPRVLIGQNTPNAYSGDEIVHIKSDLLALKI